MTASRGGRISGGGQKNTYINQWFTVPPNPAESIFIWSWYMPPTFREKRFGTALQSLKAVIKRATYPVSGECRGRNTPFLVLVITLFDHPDQVLNHRVSSQSTGEGGGSGTASPIYAVSSEAVALLAPGPGEVTRR